MEERSDHGLRISGAVRGLANAVAACVLGVLYAGLVGLIGSHLRGAFITLVVLPPVLGFCFWKWRLLRFSGYLGVLPLTILAFEIFRTMTEPRIYAYENKVLDRSHYIPGTRVSSPEDIGSAKGLYGWGLSEVLIGQDGFRADPKSGEGNPDSCRFALVGDSMIYGSGLPYSETLRPALTALGTEACVFGVAGNDTVDYLETLRYVAERMEPGAHLAIYFYVYNDFVSVSKYIRRRVGALSSSFSWLSGVVLYVDAWRQTTHTYGVFHRESRGSRADLPRWELEIGDDRVLRFAWPDDPAVYKPPGLLDRQEELTLRWFFEDLAELAAGKNWRVSIVIIPDNREMMASFARNAPTLLELDERRSDALRMCREWGGHCEDVGPYLYERTLEEGENPYFIDDRHFSAFGTRVVAEHYVKVVGRANEAFGVNGALAGRK